MALSSGGHPARRFFVGISDVRGKTPEDCSLIELLDPVAEAAGYEIVRLRLMGGNTRRLQVMAERPDGTMDVADCARLSRAVSEVLDAADPIAGEYLLEVSTPGIDRPLTRLKDFEVYAGLEARLELDRVAEGRKRFRGQLTGVEGDNVGVNLDDEPDATVYFPFAWITEAKLFLTDELLKRGAEERAARLTESDQSSEDDEE
jgi:ribosome maturation factor RimP